MAGRDVRSSATMTEALVALPRHTWTVFHDVRWPDAAYAGVHHVVVGPGGVFVVGNVDADPADVRRAALAVAAMTGPVIEPQHIHPVWATAAADLPSLITATPVALSPQQVTHLCLTLDWSVLRRD